MARQLTVRPTETPGVGRVKCPGDPPGVVCLVSRCHLCGYYETEGLRLGKGQQYIECYYPRGVKNSVDQDAICQERLRNRYATLKELGRKFNVSRERIRQILSKHGLSTRCVRVAAFFKPCETCGAALVTQARRHCSKQCRFEHNHMWVPCECCGEESPYYIKEQIWKQAHYGKLYHHFCSRSCLGKWLGQNYGWSKQREKKALTAADKLFLALAIGGFTLHHGKGVFPTAISIANKLGLTEYLREYLQSWIDNTKAQEK